MTRYWDGTRWTEHIAPPQPSYKQPPPTVYVANQPSRMVTTSRKQTNHTFHLLATVFTLGLWFPIWICVAIYNAMRHDKADTRIY